MDDLITKYKIYIHNRYQDLIKSGKTKDKLNNFDLAKIFEYYSCIKLSEDFNQPIKMKKYKYFSIFIAYKSIYILF